MTYFIFLSVQAFKKLVLENLWNYAWFELAVHGVVKEAKNNKEKHQGKFVSSDPSDLSGYHFIVNDMNDIWIDLDPDCLLIKGEEQDEYVEVACVLEDRIVLTSIYYTYTKFWNEMLEIRNSRSKVHEHEQN